ncbi:MAG: VWA domain-containing protein [Acidobacteria bacterium]|nr:VWA domain-containing protein [Acidobacteriota bacterium]
MSSRVPRIALAALVAAASPAFDQAPAPPPGESPIGMVARGVRVDVIAEDEDGQPVTDLRSEELVLTDEGRREEIVAFTGAGDESVPEAPKPLPRNTFTNRLELLTGRAPTVTAILFDGLNTPMANQEFAKRQIIGFLRQIPMGSPVSLYALGRGPHVLQDLTVDPEPLIRALEQYRGDTRVEPGAAPLPTSDAGLQHLDAWFQELSVDLVEHYAQDRALRTARSLVAIANHLERVPGRKNLIWVSGSFPVRWVTRDSVPLPGVPTSGDQSFWPEIERAARALAGANLAVYPVDARGLRSTGEYAPGQASISRQARFADRAGFETMEALAERTGGRAFVNSNDLGRAFRQAVDDSRAAYILGYEPSHDEWKGEFRRIEVKTTRPGVRLRHRRGYFAQPRVPADDWYRRGVLEAATWSPMDATRLGVTVLATPSPDGPLTLALRLHAPDVLLRPAGGRWRGLLDVWLIQLGPGDELLDTVSHVADLSLTPADHGRIMRTNEIVLMERLKPREGTVLLRILVRDVTSGALGSVSIPLDRVERDAS